MNKLMAQKKRARMIAKRGPSAEQIRSLEHELANHPARLLELKVVHHFEDGQYARELHIPAGVMLTGKVHKTDHLCKVNEGEITVWSEDTPPLRLSAGAEFISHAGAKRVGLAHTDVVFTTYHDNPTEERDVLTLEHMLVVDEPLPALEAA